MFFYSTLARSLEVVSAIDPHEHGEEGATIEWNTGHLGIQRSLWWWMEDIRIALVCKESTEWPFASNSNQQDVFIIVFVFFDIYKSKILSTGKSNPVGDALKTTGQRGKTLHVTTADTGVSVSTLHRNNGSMIMDI